MIEGVTALAFAACTQSSWLNVPATQPPRATLLTDGEQWTYSAVPGTHRLPASPRRFARRCDAGAIPMAGCMLGRHRKHQRDYTRERRSLL